MEERGAPLPGRTGSLSENLRREKEKLERMKEGMKKVDIDTPTLLDGEKAVPEK